MLDKTNAADQRYPELGLYIHGQWRAGARGEAVVNPANGAVLSYLPHASPVDLTDAVRSAEVGFDHWRKTGAAERANVLIRAANLLRERADTIAMSITLEQGKPLIQAKAEVQRASEMLEWDANEGRRAYGRVIPSRPGLHQFVMREPIGIVAGFSPWNNPIGSPARKVGGALAGGCSIILKAAEATPAGAVHLVQALHDAGAPAGVVTLLFGRPREISEFLLAEPFVRAVTFTGSVPVGRELAALAGRYLKPAVMELGGHAPVVICSDANPQQVAELAVAAKIRNAGQICVSPTRFFVDGLIFDDFLEAVSRRARLVVVGDGMDPTSQLGPLANARRVAAMERLVANALEEGASLHAGGRKIEREGNFYPLTVLANCPSYSLVMNEEPFGPIMLVNRVDSLDEAIRRANELPLGLAAYAFTSSASNVATLSTEVECGNLSINHFTASEADTPFGGVKDSGYGREGGSEGLGVYMSTKMVSHLVPHPIRQTTG